MDRNRRSSSHIFLRGSPSHFLKGGFTTIPEFLENRFSKSTRRLIAVMFLFVYILSSMPAALYGGAIAINLLFDISGSLGLSNEIVIWIVVWSFELSAASMPYSEG